VKATPAPVDLSDLEKRQEAVQVNEKRHNEGACFLSIRVGNTNHRAACYSNISPDPSRVYLKEVIWGEPVVRR
jgi:hypothetical protein